MARFLALKIWMFMYFAVLAGLWLIGYSFRLPGLMYVLAEIVVGVVLFPLMWLYALYRLYDHKVYVDEEGNKYVDPRMRDDVEAGIETIVALIMTSILPPEIQPALLMMFLVALFTIHGIWE